MFVMLSDLAGNALVLRVENISEVLPGRNPSMTSIVVARGGKAFNVGMTVTAVYVKLKST